MYTRRVINISLELLSDTIFGCGYGTQGGGDISVRKDEKGYPYLMGSTLKGLLRDMGENLCNWGECTPEDIGELFGTKGWNSVTDDRRIQLSHLTLADPPSDPEECYEKRTFTAVENGIAKEGSMRNAVCISTGLKFHGELFCHGRDTEFLCRALEGIHYMGTLRNRGFGHVCISTSVAEIKEVPNCYEGSYCLKYRVTTKLPVQMTDMERSYDHSYETRNYISGGAIRGVVINRLVQFDNRWFEENKKVLLSDSVRFLDAYPVPAEGESGAVLPSPMGFYEDTSEKHIETILKKGFRSMGKSLLSWGISAPSKEIPFVIGVPKQTV
jgi:hypothetical protein